MTEFNQYAKILNGRLVERFGIRADIILFLPRKTIKITSSGKLQRVAIKKAYEEQQLPVYFQYQLQGEQIAPREVSLDISNQDSVAKWLVARVSELTGVAIAQISEHEPLTNVGLDSVLAMEILFRLEQQTGVYLAPDVLYSCNTPSLLAEQIIKVAGKVAEKELNLSC